MAIESFTKEMKLNKKESKALIRILESKQKCDYKVTTPASKEPSQETLEMIFGKKKRK